MSDINLLRKKAQNSKSSERTLRVLRRTSFIFLFLTAISSIGLFLLNFTSPTSSLQREESKLTSSIAVYQDKAIKFLVINERVKNISTVIAKRKSYWKNIGGVINSLPSNVGVDSLSVNNNKISIVSSSESLLAINTFLDNLTSFSLKKQFFGKVSLTDLTFDTERKQYRASLDLDLL